MQYFGNKYSMRDRICELWRHPFQRCPTES